MQNLLRRNSLSSDLVGNTSDPSINKDQDGGKKDDSSKEKSGQPTEKKEGEKQTIKDQTSFLNTDMERERPLNRSISEQLQQTRSRSTSPARFAVIFSA